MSNILRSYIKHSPGLTATAGLCLLGIGGNIIRRVSKGDVSFVNNVPLEILTLVLFGTAVVTAADLLMYGSIKYQIENNGFTHDVIFNERVRRYSRIFAEATGREKEYEFALARFL